MVLAMDAISSKDISAVWDSFTTGSALGENHVKERIPSPPTLIKILSIGQETESGFIASEQW